jgi:predicted Fe-Mo cluster-binding NifX family protein
MKICIPTESSSGIKSKIFNHFGSAPYFAIYDNTTKKISLVSNDNEHHLHGKCNPITMITSQKVDAVVCLGMGARAIKALKTQGIRVYRSETSTVEKIIDRFEKNMLEEMTLDNSCQQHRCH